MRRRDFIKVIGGTAAAWPMAARAQQPKMPLIGFLSSQSLDESTPHVSGFLRGLKAFGYVDGQNVAIEYRWAMGQYDRLPELAKELTGLRPAVIAAPGVIKHTSSFASMRFGRADKRADAKLQAFVDAGKAAKIDVDISADIERERWQKFIFLTAMAGSTATLRSSIGVIRADPETLAFFRKLMEEAFAVGRAKGVALDPAYIEERIGFVLNKVEPGMKASMAHDLERGNRLELDWLNGKVRELGRTLEVPTPASDTVFTVLKLHRMGSQSA